MAKDEPNNAERESTGGAVDRRVLLAGVAATTLTGGLPRPALSEEVPKKIPLPDDMMHPYAGVYQDPTFLDTFNNKQYGVPATVHRQIHDVLYKNNRGGLKWGFYQQDLESDPNKWGDPFNYYNWPTFRDDMRNDLEKQLPFVKNSENVMDPFNPARRAPNFLDHLDEAIRVALWDRDDVQVKIEVQKAKRRHHGLITKWNPAPSSGHNPNSLTIHVECPDGGWQGYAVWRNPSPTTNPITKLVSTWQVPDAPTNVNGSQIIFLFNGLESVPQSGVPGGIVQPVLQWTKDGWFIRSWYVTSEFDPVAHPNLPKATDSVDQNSMTDGRCYSAAISVNARATVTGTITGQPAGGGKFNYTCSIASGGKTANLDIKNVPEMIFAVCALESYNVNNKNKDYPDYPSPITISSIDLQVQNSSVSPIAWVPNNKAGKDYEAKPTATGQSIDFKP